MIAPNGSKGYTRLNAQNGEFAGFTLLFDLSDARLKLLNSLLGNDARLFT